VVQLALVIVLLFGTQQDQVEIVAKGPQGWDGSIYRASESVVITYRDVRIECDAVEYNDDTRILTAEGNIKFTRGEENLEADQIIFNIDTKSGDLMNAKGEVGPGFFISAEKAHRTTTGLYDLTNATVTTCCDGPRPGWSMTHARASVDPGRRITARGSVMRLENIPIFYMPYIAVPSADRSRSTGFLIPGTGTSTTKGRSIREAFYWAINRSADATITGEYFSKRGPTLGIDFRAVPDRNSWIQVESFFARDRMGQGGSSARVLGYGDLGSGYRAAADMNFVSSFVFRQVYEDGFNVISSPMERSLAFISRNQPRLSTNFVHSRDAVFFVDQSTVVLRKFPGVELGLPARMLGKLPLYFSAETGLTGVARRDAALTTPSFVQRFDLHPVLEMPIVRSSLLSWSQRVGFRETAYTHSRNAGVVARNVLNRVSFEYSSSFVGPQLERDFGKWRHVVEPSVDTQYVGGPDRFNQTIIVDDVDLITRTNEVEYAVTNRFFTSREVFSWRLAQKYFLDPTFGGAIVPGRRNVFAPMLDISGFAFADGARRFSPIVSTMRFSTTANTSTDLEIDYDTRYRQFRSAGIIGTANRGQFSGGISYFFTRRSSIEIPNNQLRGSLTYGNQQKPGFSGAFQFSYDVQHSLFQGSAAQVGYNANCYGLSFEVSQFNLGARVESRFRFAFTLKDIGSIGTLRPRERLF